MLRDRSVWFMAAAVGLGCGGSSTGTTGVPDDGGAGAAGTAGQGGAAGAGNAAGASAEGGVGGGGTGGGGGVGAVGPGTTSAVDLLLVIDNSVSMADKQQMLGRAVPDLVSRLAATLATVDLHVGVITSSLGGHGADSCSTAQGSTFNETMNDAARFVTRDPDGGTVTTPGGLGFLAWDGSGNGDELVASLQDLVVGAGQKGCGFESTLEAWYRFLIDPEPYLSIVRVPCFAGDTSNGCAEPDGVDEELLQQRQAFLRDDSAVVVVILSDENDCSVIDGGQYFVSLQASQGAQPFLLPRSTAACDVDPADPCCYSCAQPAPAGCPSPDPRCASLGDFYTLQERGDALNLRCFDQKRRFGIDFLNPISRYVDGLTSGMVPNRAGEMVPNPLFAPDEGAGPNRNPSLVFLAGIVGVPWQDIAADSTLSGGPLVYRTAAELASSDRWDAILGDPGSYVPPGDPYMIESVEPRSGANPFTGAAIVPPGAVPPEASPINGHEWNIPDRDDLQYACIFELPTPRDCSGTYTSCDCTSQIEIGQKPLCQAPGSTAYGTTQYWAKAFPGLRHLAVLKGVGDQAIVASICPREPIDTGAPDYGYRPAVDAILGRLKGVIQ